MAVYEAAILHPNISKVIVCCSPQKDTQFKLQPSEKLTRIDIASAERGPLQRMRWLQRDFARVALEQNATVTLTLSGGAIAPAGIPSCVFIQQSLPFSQEVLARVKYLHRQRLGIVRWTMQRAASNADSLIVQTSVMRDWIANKLNVDYNRITVFEPNVVLADSAQGPISMLAPMYKTDSERRLMYLGNTSHYKNLEVLSKALPNIRAHHPGTTLFATVPSFHALARQTGVVALPYLSGSVLRQVYELATVFVMPSLVETVGLPMLEAMLTGTPVLAADRPYAHAVCKKAALFFDPLSASDFTKQVSRLLDDKTLRKQLGQAGQMIAKQRAAQKPYSQMIEHIVQLAQKR